MIQDNGAKWKVRKFTDFASNQAMPVGYVHWSISPIVPAGELPLLGGTYDRSFYADLWSWANENGLVISESEWQANVLVDGKCDKFSDGNGSTTFRVPNMGNQLINEVEDYDGLIPVMGNGEALGFSNGSQLFGVSTGSINDERTLQPMLNAYNSVAGSNCTGNRPTAGEYSIGVTTDANASGLCAKLAPKKLSGQWLIVAFGTISNIGNADVGNVMQAVEQVQTGLGTLEQGVGTAIDYIVENYRNGTEWYEVYKSGKVRQGGRVTVATTSSLTSHTITFLYKMPRSNYHVNALQVGASVSIGTGNIGTKTQEATNMVLQQVDMGAGYINWEVEG